MVRHAWELDCYSAHPVDPPVAPLGQLDAAVSPISQEPEQMVLDGRILTRNLSNHVCADPEARTRASRPGLITVILTYRVYPKADWASELAISHARKLQAVRRMPN